MDAKRFDAVARGLGNGASRRGALALLAAAAGLGVGGVAGRVQAKIADKFDVEEVNAVFVDDFLTDECGFKVTHTVTGTVKSSVGRNGLSLSRFRLA